MAVASVLIRRLDGKLASRVAVCCHAVRGPSGVDACWDEAVT